jgi:hypothetical protein
MSSGGFDQRLAFDRACAPNSTTGLRKAFTLLLTASMPAGMRDRGTDQLASVQSEPSKNPPAPG